VRQIIHIDMDAFFASVEQLDDPSLHGRPVVVGGAGRRGVVAAASYEVRPFGVRSAMPMVEALRRCPEAVVVSPRHDRYAEVSDGVFEIFRRFTPLVEGLSLDEAFLDVTESASLFGDGETIARRIRDHVRAETGLTASAGVAASKFVAKIASDLDKPDGLVVVAAGTEAGFLAPLAIERMWGVGPKAALRLHAAGFETIGDLARGEEDLLEGLLGSWGIQVRDLARGVDPRAVVPGVAAKSVGAEETFERDLTDIAELRRHLLAQSTRVARRLVAAGVSGGVVTVKLKYADFTLKTRQLRLPEPVADVDSIFEVAAGLLDRFPRSRLGVRLTGVSVSDLASRPVMLFPDARLERRRKLQSAVASIESRYGTGGITRAALLDGDEP